MINVVDELGRPLVSIADALVVALFIVVDVFDRLCRRLLSTSSLLKVLSKRRPIFLVGGKVSCAM